MTGPRPRRSRRSSAATSVAAIVSVACAATGCSGQNAPADGSPPSPLRVEIVETLEHDPAAFTQGLEIRDGELYEGTGIAGASWLRASAFPGGTAREQADLPDRLFGEGITVTDNSVWQVTWRDGVAVERDRTSLAEKRRVEYEGEGWGLCSRSDEFVMSDGSSDLTFRDPSTFAVNRTVEVNDDTGPVDRINELECAADGGVYANVWTTDTIVRIDPESGRVTDEIDASAARNALPSGTSNIDVLNGIAQIPGTDRFLVTGKYWPAMFVVRFVS